MPDSHELSSQYGSLSPLLRKLVADGFTACWASSGYTAAGCQALETQLRACMDAPVRYRSYLKIAEDMLMEMVIAETENSKEEYD
jgi:hypothetical protein